MINARRKRIEKSQENNPTWPGYKMKRKQQETNEKVSTKKFKSGESSKIQKIEPNKKPFTGTVGKPGENKLRSKFKLKNQAAVHHETVKKEKKLKRNSKKLEEKREHRNENKNEVKVSITSDLPSRYFL